MGTNKEDLKNYVTGWMTKSRQTFKDCLILMDIGDNAGVVNRAYYASFHALIALLVTVDDHPQPEEDEEALTKFERDFVTAGKISKKTAETIRELYELQKAIDFERLEPVCLDEAQESVEKSERVYNAISRYLFAQGLLEETK